MNNEECPQIYKSSKNFIENYIRNIVRQEISKEKQFEKNFKDMQDNINFEIWKVLNTK